MARRLGRKDSRRDRPRWLVFNSGNKRDLQARSLAYPARRRGDIGLFHYLLFLPPNMDGSNHGELGRRIAVAFRQSFARL